MKLSALLLSCLAVAGSAAAQGPPEVFTKGEVQMDRPGVPGNEGPKRYEVLPPPKDAVPVPLPDMKRRGVTPPGKNRMVSYDPRTGVEKTYAPPSPGGPASDFVTGTRLRGGVAEPESWNNGLTRVSSTNFPWSTSCKVFMTIGTKSYQASATMIDMKHVITAGHVVNGGKNSPWATNVRVFPAWNGSSNAFGGANGINLYSWSGWTNSSDFNHDLGLIRLDRPVGCLTGNFGYGYNNSNSFFTSKTFNMAGYPASGYTGAPNAMYYGYGKYDSVSTYRLNASTNWSYRPGGMSGSGSYVLNGSNRTVYAVMSTATASSQWGHPNRNIGHTRINSAKFTYIRDTAIPAAYSKTRADYVPMAVKVSIPSGGLRPGDALSGMNYRVCNASLYDPPKKTFNVDVYLSTNDNISKADRKIQNHNFTFDFGKKSSVTVNVGVKPVIPCTTQPGTYWIGVILNENDGDVNNNDTDGWDAAKVTISKPYETAPSGFLCKEGNSSHHIPSRYAPARSQQLYDASILSGLKTGVIRGIALRRNGTGSATYTAHKFRMTIHMSSSGVKSAAGWSKTSYLANRGTDYKAVVSNKVVNFPAAARPSTAPAPFSVTVPFTTPFSYFKGRNLLVQFDTTNYPSGVGSYNWYADAQYYSSSAKAGTVVKYGKGCPSGLVLHGYAPPINGTSKLYWYWYSKGGYHTPAMAILGVSDKTWGFLILPFSLAGMGAPGCYLNADMVLAFVGFTDSTGTNGRYRVDLSVPYDPSLAGGVLYGQTLVFDSGYNSLGVRASEGLKFTLGTYMTPRPALHLYTYGVTPPFSNKPRYYSNTVNVLQLIGL